jgi:hypothetical protein
MPSDCALNFAVHLYGAQPFRKCPRNQHPRFGMECAETLGLLLNQLTNPAQEISRWR